MFSMRFWLAFVLIILGTFGVSLNIVEGKARRILLDTDVDTDDFFALLYLLKLNRSEFKLEVRKTKLP
jgi:metal-dependent hydrolase (beta-lactamase superfamily II)